MEDASEIALEDCLKAIDNGNCARDCRACPIWKRFGVTKEDGERAIREHVFGTEDP